MNHPEFFKDIPHLVLRDPLARFLGAIDDGIVDFSYLDVVKLAGHSCPTVASAYWMTWLALKALYGDQLPERGAIRVEFSEGLEVQVTGVMANVISMLTGACAEGGFKGIGGRFARRHLIAFETDIPLAIRFERSDSGQCVDVAAALQHVPVAPEMFGLMQRCLNDQATVAEQRQFGWLWQDRVRRLLTEYRDDPAVFQLRCLS
jgi:hypothetical protein